MLKATRKARKISKKEKATILGWIDCTDTYDMYDKWIKPYVNFQQLKRKVFKYDKQDGARVYLKLVSLYTVKGGKVDGVKL